MVLDWKFLAFPDVEHVLEHAIRHGGMHSEFVFAFHLSALRRAEPQWVAVPVPVVVAVPPPPMCTDSASCAISAAAAARAAAFAAACQCCNLSVIH